MTGKSGAGAARRGRAKAAARTRTPVVADLMKRDVVTVSPEATVGELIGVLHTHAIGGVPVVDAAGELLGTVSSTDVLWLAGGEDGSGSSFIAPATLRARRVRDIMTPDVFGVRPGDSLGALRRFFARTGVQRALVLDENRVVGIVTLSDVLGTIVE